jgi:hypothetical protein
MIILQDISKLSSNLFFETKFLHSQTSKIKGLYLMLICQVNSGLDIKGRIESDLHNTEFVLYLF